MTSPTTNNANQAIPGYLGQALSAKCGDIITPEKEITAATTDKITVQSVATPRKAFAIPVATAGIPNTALITPNVSQSLLSIVYTTQELLHL